MKSENELRQSVTSSPSFGRLAAQVEKTLQSANLFTETAAHKQDFTIERDLSNSFDAHAQKLLHYLLLKEKLNAAM